MNGCNEILDHEIETTAPAVGVGARRLGLERVWLVDDNDRFRSLLVELLNEEGFDCEREFANPDEALAALAQETPPDIILLDIQMGEYNGLDAVGPIKAAAKETHVLMLTTFAPREARERAFREGASDFLLKSWTLDEIASHMRQAMEFGAVAGLMTTALSGGISTADEAFVAPKPAPVVANPVATPTLTIAERWMSYLRGLMKFSPSKT